MAAPKEYVKLWLSYMDYFSAYSDQEVGRIVRAMLQYRSDGTAPNFCGSERFVWPAIKRDIDESVLALERKAEANRKNGKLGGRPSFGGAEASNVILSRMATEFGGSMEKQSQTFAGLTSTVQGLHNELAVSMGEGYTARRMEGLQAERDFLEGETGTAMKTVNEIVGQNYTTRDNLNDQLKREILNGVFGNGDISNLDAEEAEQVQLLREQWAEASADLLSSDEKTRAEAESQMVQVQNQVDMLIEAVQTTSGLTETWRKADLETAKAAGAIAEKIGAYKPGFELSKEMDKGILASKISTTSPEEATKAATAFRVRGDFQPVQSAVSVHERGDFQPVQRAIGQHVIPYNNFPILAHQGEMLLTAQEARQHKSGGRTINVNVQTMNVNKSSDLEELARMLAERIEWAEMTAQ